MPITVNFTHIACGDESVDVVLLHIIHKMGKLILSEEGLNFNILMAVVATCNVVQ